MKGILPLSTLFVILALYLAPLATFQSNAAASVNISTLSTTSAIGLVRDNFYGGASITEVQQGANLNISVIATPSGCPTVGCNLSIGFAFDTLSNCCGSANLTGYTNASNARPTSTLTALNAIPYLVTFQVPAPATASNLITHDWELAIANMAHANSASGQTYLKSNSGTVGIVSADQAGYQIANQNYTTTSSSFGALLSSALASQSGYQYSQAVSLATKAGIAYNKATTLYAQGSFSQANTQMTLAMNDYLSAVQSYQSSASSVSGAQNTYSTLLPYGALMLGIGAIVAAVAVLLGGFRKGS